MTADPFVDDDGHQLRERGINCVTPGCRARGVRRASGLCDECRAHEDEVGAREAERQETEREELETWFSAS